ncbi:hypothetical protein [Herpetosiphon gulosus]|uniref:Uncharacterized protein n=1 Tax=Herpetosiphon gulosus TaxID=1973496 RepID=A0ABP9WZ82_9CHLR
MSNQLPPTTPIQPSSQPPANQQPSQWYAQQPYQTPPQAYGNPSYSVPTQSVNASNSWLRWIGFNLLAMILSNVVFGILFFLMVIWLFIDGYQSEGILNSIDSQTGEVVFIIGLGTVITGISAIAAGWVQRIGLHKRVSYWPWMLKTALITAIMTCISLSIFFFIINPKTSADNFQLINTLFSTASTAAIALATALGQFSEVKKITPQPFTWIVISVLTWTSLTGILSAVLFFSL